jgi:hypothetical protein
MKLSSFLRMSPGRPWRLSASARNCRGRIARGNSRSICRQAQRILGALYEAGERDSETLGIYARTWMDRYARSKDPADLRESRDLYGEEF